MGKRISLAGVLVLLLGAFTSSAAADSRRVLLLHSFGRDFAPFSQISSLFREQLTRTSPEPVDLYEASVETARFGDPKDDKALIEYLRVLFADRKLDLIVTMGGPAARFVQRFRHQLFVGTPMLITAVERGNIDPASLEATDAVVAFALDHAAILRDILRILPETTDVVVIHGNSPFERIRAAQTGRGFETFGNRVRFTWLNELPFDDIRAKIAKLPAHSIIYFGLFAVDANGVPRSGDRALQLLHAQTSAPIFSYIDTYMGRGIVGGPLLSQVSITREAVDAALRILTGQRPVAGNFAVLGPESPVYDWRELRRWNIAESSLPAGSTVMFREPTLWQQYQWQISAIAAVLLVQAFIITLLLIERQRRERAERESRTRLLQVAHLNRTAAAGALSASIAHELNQPLGAIHSYADAAEKYLSANPPKLDRALAMLTSIRQDDERAAGILANIRGLLKQRSEMVLKDIDLNEAISSILDTLEVEASKRSVLLVPMLAKEALSVRADKVHLQQVVLNLALNSLDAIRESGATRAILKIDCAALDDRNAEVSVSDTGPGIPKDKLQAIFEAFYTTKDSGTGLGLSIARTIIETYGGRIWAENLSGGGAVFRFTLPLAKGVTA